MQKEEFIEKNGSAVKHMKKDPVGIKKFRDTVLCNHWDESIWIYVTASIKMDAWPLLGMMWGKTVEFFWQDDDYEYWYFLDEVGTSRLLEAIDGLDEPEAALKREFSVTDGYRRFIKICEAKGIPYGFNSYAWVKEANMEFGKNILYYQKQKNMTQEQLADVLFVDWKMMKHWKRILR